MRRIWIIFLLYLILSGNDEALYADESSDNEFE